jgi:hypothetical protein
LGAEEIKQTFLGAEESRVVLVADGDAEGFDVYAK